MLMKVLTHGLTVGQMHMYMLKARQKFSSVQAFVPKSLHSFFSKLIHPKPSLVDPGSMEKEDLGDGIFYFLK
jgi:hypothetical protein